MTALTAEIASALRSSQDGTIILQIPIVGKVIIFVLNKVVGG